MKFAVLIIVSRRERHDILAHFHKVLSLACENDCTLFVMAVIKRSDTDRVSCGYVLACLCIIDNHCKLGIKHLEHINAVFTVHRENDLTVRAALKCIFFAKLFLCFFKSVKLTVADCIAAVKLKRLHSFGGQSHNRKTVKA